MTTILKCRNCRGDIATVASEALIDAHSVIEKDNVDDQSCRSVQDNNEIYIHEDFIPDWITKNIELSEWTKGKLKCLKCETKIGSFDFLSGNKCFCGRFLIPAVQFVKSKVDVPVVIELNVLKK